MSGQCTLWKSLVEVQCRIGVIFVILNHLKAKISTGGTVRRAGRYQRWLRAPAGGVETKEFFPGRLDVGIAAAEAGLRFRADQSEVVVCWNLHGTKSSGSGRSSGGELRRVATVGSTQHGFYWFGLYDKH